MWCPECGEKTRVVTIATGEENIRTRQCPDCGCRIITVERVLVEHAPQKNAPAEKQKQFSWGQKNPKTA